MKTFLVIPLEGDRFRVEAETLSVDEKSGVAVFESTPGKPEIGALSLDSVVGVFEIDSVKDS